MVNDSFFDEMTEYSKIKTEIVEKYFYGWACIITNYLKSCPHRKQEIGYIDLFSGPGNYRDGSKSTPMLILQKVIENDEYVHKFRSLFNDIDNGVANSLRENINSFQGIEKLKFKPIVVSYDISNKIDFITNEFTSIPTLAFVDPWGYKGATLELISSLIKNWGCDCIFFFNYKRINPALSNPFFENHMNALFGEKYSKCLMDELKQLDIGNKFNSPELRMDVIVEKFTQALKEAGGKYVLPFGFTNESGNRTLRFLIFVTKHF